MAGSRPVTPASPKIHKPKDPEPGVPLFGCGIFSLFSLLGDGKLTLALEHMQLLMTKSQDVTTNTIQYYKMLLRVIFDNTPIIPQTSKSPGCHPVTSLTPNYLCLQCPTTTTAQDRLKHGKLKAHMFCKTES
jgi:ubiquitin carboxyl-terminal hydrolase 22/27/51